MSGSNSAWNATAAVAAFSTAFGTDRLHAEHFRQCARALIDTVAVAYAGRHEEASLIALRYARLHGGERNATAWGTGTALPIEHAALYNGVAGHVLDYDDVTSPLRGHPSIALLPPLVALAEAFDATGSDFVAAYVVGFEVICKLAKVMVGDHYAKGWHSTASVGTLAATAACARLLGLNATQCQHALGIAVAQTAGSRANFGTMTKSFQAGQCGAAAIRAVLLAQAGFTGSPDILAGEFGYMALYANGENLRTALGEIGQGPLEIDTSGIEIKKYPLCYATHRAIDGVLDLRAEHGLTLDTVRSVAITSNKRALVPLIYPRPQTGLEAKFSMQYAVVAALLDGNVTLGSFADDAVQRPAVQARLQSVTALEDDGEPLPRWSRIRVVMNDGREIEKMVTTLRGAANCPLSDDELVSKARDCFAFSGHAQTIDRFIEGAFSLATLRVKDVIGRLGGDAR